ncbi:cytochrome P450 [Streptomyces populi]|uniref:cytochrome P450 n=1 Tax=Streptomyces populi TaxID=2058924 RepID=UPI001F0C1564|nr:cytochrome P450 [Streptomyces populi]
MNAVPSSGRPARQPLYGPEFAADPAAVYRRLRAFGPTAPVELAPGVRATLVTGYDAALHVLRSPETFSKDPRHWRDLADGTVPPDSPVVPMMMYRPSALFTDGEEHGRLRGAVTDTLARVEAGTLRGYAERSADTLIDRFAPLGAADLLGEYAQVLPLLVFDHLFGCPAGHGVRLVEGMSGMFDGVDAGKAYELLVATLADLVELKRRRPAPDVTSWLMEHPAALTDEELVHTLAVLMGAGTEPQQNLIANGLRLLLSDDRFAGDLSGGTLPVEDALDEVLWTDPPIANYAVHYPRYDVVYEGTLLRAGDPLVVSLAAANTDPAQAGRRHPGNRAHLAWSAGPHTCPARGPARLIASVAVEKLLDRIPGIEPAVPVEELRWRPGPFHRALVALPVGFPPAPVVGRSGGGRAEGAPRSPSGPFPPSVTESPAPEPGRPRSVRARTAAWWRGE